MLNYHTTPAPTQKEGKKLPQYVAALSVCLGSLAAGGVLGWTGNISEDMKSQSFRGISIDDHALGWIGSITTLGASFSCLPIGKMCDWFGRKKTMLSLTVPFLIGWILILFPQSLMMIYVGRFLTGMAGCAFCVAAPIYTSEIAEKSVRGILGSYFELLLTVGILIAYIIPIFVNIFVYTICLAVLPLLFAIVFVFQPESPVYTIKQNKEKSAETALIRLRGAKYDPKLEILDIKRGLLEDNSIQLSFFESLKKKATKKAFVISLSLMFFQQAGGINAIVFYTQTIFESAGSTLNPQISTIIVGLMQVIATFVSGIVVDKLGRRILLIASNAIVTVCGVLLGIYFTLKERSLISEDSLTSLGLLPVISLSVFVTSFSSGMGPIPWVLSTELFPPEVRGIGTGLASTFNWFIAFLVSKFYLDLQNAIGSDVTFYLYSFIAFLSTLFIYLFVPETKDKTMNEIQLELTTSKWRYTKL
ncbi:hypothetical protein FQR65_LT05740 [Abscondita terminalis]|nr:hypothetical protein FQR65_LT05740 [Abscondita terminalis]